MKHTPGTWVATFNENGGYDCMFDSMDIEASEQLICAVDFGIYGQVTSDDSVFDATEAKANASLIAAAPDLLEAARFTKSLVGDLMKINPDEPNLHLFKAVEKVLSGAIDKATK